MSSFLRWLFRRPKPTTTIDPDLEAKALGKAILEINRALGSSIAARKRLNTHLADAGKKPLSTIDPTLDGLADAVEGIISSNALAARQALDNGDGALAEKMLAKNAEIAVLLGKIKDVDQAIIEGRLDMQHLRSAKRGTGQRQPLLAQGVGHKLKTEKGPGSVKIKGMEEGSFGITVLGLRAEELERYVMFWDKGNKKAKGRGNDVTLLLPEGTHRTW